MIHEQEPIAQGANLVNIDSAEQGQGDNPEVGNNNNEQVESGIPDIN